MIADTWMPCQWKMNIIPNIRTIFFADKKEIHYIGGSDILPAPLELERETEAI